MLVFARRQGDSVILGDDIEVTVVAAKRNKVLLGFKAPDTLRIRRKDRLAKFPPSSQPEKEIGNETLPAVVSNEINTETETRPITE